MLDAAPQRGRRGFTLIEAALCTIIVGVAILAVVSAFTAFHQKNAWAARVATATYLANELREMTYHLPRHDPVTGDEIWGPESNELGDPLTSLDDLDDLVGLNDLGTIFTNDDTGYYFPGNLHPPEDILAGPINARRVVIDNMAEWAQIVNVYNVDPYNIAFDPDDTAGLPGPGTTNMMAVVVEVYYRGPNDTEPSQITRISWIAPK